MTGLPHPDPRATEDLLRRLSGLLDEARGPLQQLALPRVPDFPRRQQALLDKLGGRLPEPGGGQGTPDGILVDEVRRKLLRNRVVAAHVLDFAAQLQGRLGREDADGYAADGQATDVGATGQLIRTSV